MQPLSNLDDPQLPIADVHFYQPNKCAGFFAKIVSNKIPCNSSKITLMQTMLGVIVFGEQGGNKNDLVKHFHVLNMKKKNS